MKKRNLIFIFILLLLLLQANVLGNLKIFGVSPDVIFLAFFLGWIFLRSQLVFLLAIVLGLLKDALLFYPLGFNSVLFCGYLFFANKISLHFSIDDVFSYTLFFL